MSVFACADLHGCKWAWDAIKDFLKPEDKLYFLGDAADRGPDGWVIMKELLADPRVTYIKGNHEDLMIKAVGKCNPTTFHPNDFFWDKYIELWFANGGSATYESFRADPDRFKVIEQVKNLPFVAAYHNTSNETVYLLHAGCNANDIDNLTERNAIWDRTHYMLNDWDGRPNEVIVHGHTPIPIMVEDQDKIATAFSNSYQHTDIIEPGAYWYAKGHKVNIDCGAVFTGVMVMINLDTWDEEIFYQEAENEKS